MNDKKEKALEAYKKAKADYLKNISKENWIAFCEAKMVCRLLGIII